MAVNDCPMRSINRNVMLVCVRAQIKRKRYSDQLCNRLEESVEMALMDSLTSLYNRPYMENHLSTLVEESVKRGKPLSMLTTDIDYFKAANDTHGHDAGDLVLQEFSSRLRSNIRGIDLACRFGDEEFVVIMPDTDMTRRISRSNICARLLPANRFYLLRERSLRQRQALVSPASKA